MIDGEEINKLYKEFSESSGCPLGASDRLEAYTLGAQAAFTYLAPLVTIAKKKKG